MKRDKIKWDGKYTSIDYQRKVSKLLVEIQSQMNIEAGTALDIACGLGQNSLFLAEKGFKVDSLDISDIALSQFSHPKVSKKQVDFDTYRFQENHYDLIIDFYFLERRLFPYIIAALKPGGFFIFESFLSSKETFSNPDHKLRSQELLHAFLPLQIISYVETDETATLVAKRVT